MTKGATRRVLRILCVLLSDGSVSGQDLSIPNRAALMTGLGRHHHAISTNSPEAQKFFDQGLNLVFAFNYEDALQSFRRAAELDPQSAMAQWGIALALGPNINLETDPGREDCLRSSSEGQRARLDLSRE